MNKEFTLRVEPILAEDGFAYVGQCVEYDICVQGSTFKELIDRFIGSINGHIILSLENDQEPFVNLPKGTIDQGPPDDPSIRRSFPMPVNRLAGQLPLEDKYALNRMGEVNLTFA